MSFWFGLMIMAVMCAVMSIYMTGTITLEGYLSTLWKGVLLSVILGMIIPLGKIGAAFATFCRARPDSLLFQCLAGLPPTVIITLIVSFAFTFFAIGFSQSPAAIFFGGLSAFPVGVVVAYPCAIFLMPVAARLTDLMVKK